MPNFTLTLAVIGLFSNLSTMSEFNLIKIEGKALEKLISVIGKGLGRKFKSKQIRRIADAKAYEIKVISKTETKAKIADTKAEFELELQLTERLQHIETKRQKNLNSINYIAAEQLEQETDVSDEPLDEDWITRFFNLAQDVSNQEMQGIWARILAGEVKQPHTYSMRTLETLKNLSQKEAELFSKVSKIRLVTGFTFIMDNNKEKLLEEMFGINYGNVLTLMEADLISAGQAAAPFSSTSTGSRIYLRMGNKVGVVERTQDGGDLSMNCFPFTNVGTELAELIEAEFNEEYMEEVFRIYHKRDKSVRFLLGDAIHKGGKKWTMHNLNEYNLAGTDSGE
jgi:uncharacterized repeat protein (TIGR03899 family)